MIGDELLRRVALAAIATLAIAASACSSSTTSATSTIASPPGVTSFKPASGPVGTVVTIKGTNLAGATEVAFNGVTGTLTKDTARKIKVKVPAGATTGKIEIVTPKGHARTATVFTVT